MKGLGDMLLSQDAGSEIMIGNTALVRAMVESGTQVVTAYPGSPTPEIATAIAAIPLDKRPFYFEFSTNEKVALEVALGASVNGHASCVFFKSVGLNVAADTFVQLSLLELVGGMVVILGDDPGANSSQNEQDNRHLARLAYVPVLEPADPIQAYAMYLEALRLSRERRKPVILRMTTHVCHAKMRVPFAAYRPEPHDRSPRFDPANGPYIPLTSRVFPLKAKALANIEWFRSYAEKCPFNRLLDHGNRRRGIIVAGLPLRSLEDVLLDSADKPDVLALGMPYPLPSGLVGDFLSSHAEVKILEELDDFVEQQVKAIAYERRIDVVLKGKSDIDDWIGEYGPDKVAEVLRKVWPDLLPPAQARPQVPVTVSARPPQLCPGCGHRTAFYAVRKAISDAEITLADVGCHTLGFLPPYNVGQMFLDMGASVPTGSGLALFNKTRPVIAFLGDSTLFHAGLPGIINAVFNKHNLTLIVMENGTTAMTGHQDHAGSGQNFNGETPAVRIDSVLEAIGVTPRRVDAYAVGKLTALVREAIGQEGFKVIIASHPCMLKATRDARRKGDRVEKMVRVDQDKCSRARECISRFACPTFQFGEDGSIDTHSDLCIGDGSCLQTCPAHAITPPRAK